MCVWFYFAQIVSQESAEAADIRAVAETLGGSLDGGFSRMLVLAVPLSAGFATIAQALDDAAARHAGFQWLYGNVYDPIDGETPLSWWR